MKPGAPWVLLVPALVLSTTIATRGAPRPDEVPISIRPATLAVMISELAGHRVRVPDARVVGVFEPKVFLIENQARLRSIRGFKDRVVVLIEPGTLKVPPSSLVASTVTVFGVARTLLGVQVTGEVPWPPILDRSTVDRLEIRAALLATSVQTAEGVELTDRAPARRGTAPR